MIGLSPDDPRNGVYPADVAVESPQPLGFVGSVVNAYWQQVHVGTPYGLAQDLANEDDAQIQRMREAGIPDGEIPLALNANDQASIFTALSSDKSFIRDAMDVENSQTVQDKVMAEQHWRNAWSHDELRFARLKEKYPNVPIMTRREMLDKTIADARKKIWEGEGAMGGPIGFIAGLAGGGAGGLSPAMATRDPILFMQNIATFGAGSVLRAAGVNTAKRLMLEYGMNFTPQFLDRLTGTNENMRWLGYTPTLGQTVLETAAGAAIPLAPELGGRLIGAGLRRLSKRFLDRVAPETPPARLPETPAEMPPEPQPSPYGKGEFTYGRTGTSAEELTYRYAGEDRMARVRLAKDATADEEQMNEYGQTADTVMAPSLDKYSDFAPHDPRVDVPVRSMNGVLRVEDYNSIWNNLTEGMSAVEAAKLYDPQVFKRLTTLTNELSREIEAGRQAATLNAERVAGQTATFDRLAAEYMQAVQGARAAGQRTQAARALADLVERWKSGEKFDERAVEISKVKQKLTDFRPNIHRAFARSQGLWELSAAQAEKVNAAIEAMARELAITAEAGQVGYGRTAGRKRGVVLEDLERASPVKVDEYSRVAIPELSHPDAVGGKPGEPKIAAVQRVQKAQAKTQDEALVAFEDQTNRWVDDIVAREEAGGTEPERIAIQVAGREYAVYTSEHVGDQFGNGEGQGMTVREMLEEVKSDSEAMKAISSCQPKWG